MGALLRGRDDFSSTAKLAFSERMLHASVPILIVVVTSPFSKKKLAGMLWLNCFRKWLSEIMTRLRHKWQ